MTSTATGVEERLGPMQPDQAEQGGEYRKLLEELAEAEESDTYRAMNGSYVASIAQRFRALAKEPQP